MKWIDVRTLPFILAISMVVILSHQAVHAEENGFHVKNGRILEYNGSDFIARGVNFPYAWFINNWNSSVSGIAGTGANCVRVVCSNGKRAGWPKTGSSELQQIIQKCKDNKLIAILEIHDCTGYPDQSGSAQLSTAVSYWKEMKGVLTGQEKYVWINIANEPFGNNASKVDWVDQHKSAITELRGAGFQHLLVCDAANWGQDYTNTSSGSAGLVLQADDMNRTVISVHMYDIYKTDNVVNTYMKKYVDKQWPLLIGEFASDHGSGKPIDEQAVLDRAKEYGIGYCGWSWAGNGGDLATLDITNNFNAGSLTAWGTTLINGNNGIKQTSNLATIHGGKFVEPPVAVEVPRVAAPRNGGNMQFRLFDMSGRLVGSGKPVNGNHTSSFDTRGLPAGCYIVRCIAGDAEIGATAVTVR